MSVVSLEKKESGKSFPDSFFYLAEVGRVRKGMITKTMVGTMTEHTIMVFNAIGKFNPIHCTAKLMLVTRTQTQIQSFKMNLSLVIVVIPSCHEVVQ